MCEKLADCTMWAWHDGSASPMECHMHGARSVLHPQKGTTSAYRPNRTGVRATMRKWGGGATARQLNDVLVISSVTTMATPLAKGRTLRVSSGRAGWTDNFWSAADNAHETAGERRRSALPSTLRGWAFAHQLNDTALYPNATLNFNPTWSTAHPSSGEGEPSIAAQNARGIACLGWGQCWNAAGSHAFNRTTNRSHAARLASI